jgi:hypothetical protein
MVTSPRLPITMMRPLFAKSFVLGFIGIYPRRMNAHQHLTG